MHFMSIAQHPMPWQASLLPPPHPKQGCSYLVASHGQADSLPLRGLKQTQCILNADSSNGLFFRLLQLCCIYTEKLVLRSCVAMIPIEGIGSGQKNVGTATFIDVSRETSSSRKRLSTASGPAVVAISPLACGVYVDESSSHQGDAIGDFSALVLLGEEVSSWGAPRFRT